MARRAHGCLRSGYRRRALSHLPHLLPITGLRRGDPVGLVPGQRSSQIPGAAASRGYQPHGFEHTLKGVKSSAARDSPGDTVDGFACEYVTMQASAFTSIPVGYSDEEAATLPCAGLTAWTAHVDNGRIKPGDVVLTQGTGGVSLFALQFARAAGAMVISTSSSDEKLERLKALGADHVVNYRTEPEWGKAVLKLTDGRGVDHVVEVGGVGTLDQSVVACRPGGAHSSYRSADGLFCAGGRLADHAQTDFSAGTNGRQSSAAAGDDPSD